MFPNYSLVHPYCCLLLLVSCYSRRTRKSQCSAGSRIDQNSILSSIATVPFTFATEHRSARRQQRQKEVLDKAVSKSTSRANLPPKVEIQGRLGAALTKWLQRAMNLRESQKTVAAEYLISPWFRSQQSVLRDYIHGVAPAPFPKHKQIAVECYKDGLKRLDKDGVKDTSARKKTMTPLQNSGRKSCRKGSQTARVQLSPKSLTIRRYEGRESHGTLASRWQKPIDTLMERLKYGTRSELEEYCQLWRSTKGISKDQKVMKIQWRCQG